MNWSDAYGMTRDGELWGYIDLSVNFTEETRAKYEIINFSSPNLLPC